MADPGRQAAPVGVAPGGRAARFGSRQAGRIAGVDLARGLAVIGMFVAHASPRADDAELLVDGRSSILFATLAGVSLGIMTGGERPTGRAQRADRVLSILWRACALFVIGLLMSTADSNVLVILDYYAVMFILMTPALFLPRWALGMIAVLLAVSAPMMAAWMDERSEASGRAPDVLTVYLLTGSYPALVWLPFLVAGLICARSGLDRTATHAWMVTAGAACSALGYTTAAVLPAVTAEAHSGSTAELLGSGGLAVAVTGALLWLTSPSRAGFGRAFRAAMWPISATGSMALTVYTLQIVTLALVVQAGVSGAGVVDYPGWPLLTGMTVVSVAFASVWARFIGKGPLERVLSLTSHPPTTG